MKQDDNMNQIDQILYKVHCKWKDLTNYKDCSYRRKSCIKHNTSKDLFKSKSYNCHIVYFIDWIQYIILKNDIEILGEIKTNSLKEIFKNGRDNYKM